MCKSLIQFDLRKGLIGLALGICVFVVSAKLSAPISGALLALAFCVFGFFRLTPKSKCAKAIFCIIWTAAILAVIWLYSLTIINSAYQLRSSVMLVLLNLLCLFLVCEILFVLTANWNVSATVGSVLLVLLSTANGFVYQFRGKELLSFDFLSVSTALNVVEQYSPTITPMMFFGFALWIFVLFLQFTFPKFHTSGSARTRALAALATLSSALLLFTSAKNVRIELWNTHGSIVNGYHLNFLLSIRDSVVQRPETYSPEVLPQEVTPVISEGKHPNVIVIMNESFSDLRVFGGELNTNVPVLPFYDSLKQESIYGYALASIFGANTANSEFEFLTGHSMAFLPAGSVAYQQFIHGELFTLPHLMNSYGYNSIATHPYYANGWSRKRNYPLFGFSESTFMDAYPSQNLLRDWISDQEMYEFMLKRLDEETERPLFFFGVSMQNHGGYNYEGEDFVKTISLTDYPDQFPLAEQYLTLLQASDNALNYLITSLRDYPEDTVVLLFGDHLPRVENELFEVLSGGPLDTLDKQMRQYSVPFFIWANYDLDAREIEHTSLNYLSCYLLEAAGLELSPYHKKLKELSAIIPAINTLGYYSASQGQYLSFNETTPEDKPTIDYLALLQYNNLFDPAARNMQFFGQFLPIHP